jgi:dienelactone hydrolase
MKTCRFEYQHSGTIYEGFSAVPSGDIKKPVVLVFPAWRGRDQFSDHQAELIAQLGFAAVVIDLYGKGVRGTTDEECSKLMQPFLKRRSNILEITQQAILEAKKVMSADFENMAAMGFCFGGLCALDMARADGMLKGAVSFHGLLTAKEGLDVIQAKILVFHGYRDPMVSHEAVLAFCQEMDQKNADFQIVILGQAMHAFTQPAAQNPHKGTLYHEPSAKRAFHGMHQFLKEIFKA